MAEVKKTLIFPDFDEIKVSTKTFTATTNIEINIQKLFDTLPITDYEVVPKKRGRKKKIETVNPNKDILFGSIITLKHEGNLRGVELKKPPKKKKKWFRNSVTVVIVFDKIINFKVCRNGTFQMTGCKSREHAENCVKYIWDHIKDDDSLYSYNRGSNKLETLFIPSMRNIDFSLGFTVDREKLDKYMKEQSEFHCLLETLFGYTGVNIKIPLKQDISKMKIKKIVYGKDDMQETITTYAEYLDLLSPKDRASKIKSERYNTFLVFHSGKVIMSGLTSEFMENVYYDFLNLIRKSYDKIEERLDT